MAQQLEDLRKETRTKEQQLAHEKKQLEEQYTKQLTDEKKAREEWENRYREGTVERALQDAAVSGDAFNADTVMSVLRPMTRLTEITDEKTGKGTGKFKVVVDFPDTDPNTGEPTVTLHTPESAVKRMKELPQIYGNLFKSGVVSGIGSSAATGGLASGGGGKIDPTEADSSSSTWKSGQRTLRCSDCVPEEGQVSAASRLVHQGFVVEEAACRGFLCFLI